VGRALPYGVTGRNFLCHAGLQGMERYLDACALFRPADQARLFSPETFDRLRESDPFAFVRGRMTSPNGAWLSALQQLDLEHYLPLDILTKADRMSMAHSIELRPALLDHRLVEFAATIPPELQMRGGTTKRVFKHAMRGILPDAIIDRPKHGFAVPVGRWFRREWADYVHDTLLSDACRQRGLLNRPYVERLLRLHDRGRDLDLQLWTLVSLELWCRAFLDTTRRSQRARANVRVMAPAVPAFVGASVMS
jgi:asparagine synthase (glutamine-hydrolysing)